MKTETTRLPFPRMRDALGRTEELRDFLEAQYGRFLCPKFFEETSDAKCDCPSTGGQPRPAPKDDAEWLEDRFHPLCDHFVDRFSFDTLGRWSARGVVRPEPPVAPEPPGLWESAGFTVVDPDELLAVSIEPEE